ncbi:hypothetical protein LINPERHAP2_LOCUS4095, partial [Linum perenne]
ESQFIILFFLHSPTLFFLSTSKTLSFSSINPSSTLEQGANWSKELGLKPTTLGRGACKKRIAMEPLVTFSLSFSCVPLAMCG